MLYLDSKITIGKYSLHLCENAPTQFVDGDFWFQPLGESTFIWRAITGEWISVFISESSDLAANIESQIAYLAATTARKSYSAEFTQTQLNIAGVFPCTHNLGLYPASITVWDGEGEQIHPDRISYLDSNAIAVDLSSYIPLIGTYKIVVSE